MLAATLSLALVLTSAASPSRAGVPVDSSTEAPIGQVAQSPKHAPVNDKGKLPNYNNGISSAQKVIVIEGEIGVNFANQLSLEIERNPGAMIEIGDSPGGLIEEAIKAGRILRRLEKPVTVKGSCASACVLVFAGGKERQMEEGAELGVHRSTWGGRDLRMSAEEVQEASGRIGQFYIDMGISAEILVLQLRTPINDMSWLTLEDARAYGFIE